MLTSTGVSSLTPAQRRYYEDLKYKGEIEKAAIRGVARGVSARSAFGTAAEAAPEATGVEAAAGSRLLPLAGRAAALLAPEVVIPAAGAALLVGIATGPQWKPAQQQPEGSKTNMWQPST
jgi:hypothetical protein